MAFSKPIGRVGIVGRSERARSENLRLISETVELMPRDAVFAAVVRYYDSRQAHSLAEAFGGDLVLDNLDPALLHALNEEFHREGQSREGLDHEVDLARRELAKLWIDSLLAAWSTFGKSRQRLVLDEHLLPAQSPGANADAPKWAKWQRLYEESVHGVLSSIAIDSEKALDRLRPSGDYGVLHRRLVETIKKRIRANGPLNLPDRLQIGTVQSDFVLTEGHA